MFLLLTELLKGTTGVNLHTSVLTLFPEEESRMQGRIVYLYVCTRVASVHLIVDVSVCVSGTDAAKGVYL